MESVLRIAIEDALKELGFGPRDFVIEHPTEMSHGDYATNAAMVLAKEAGKNPREIAESLKEKLDGQIEYISKIDVAGPGFLNFYLHRDFFAGEVARISRDGEEWGKNDLWADKKVLVEYTDPNPFKEFHIGHLFTNAVGESIARLFMFSGADTKRVNYQGDVGMHVANAIWGMKQAGIIVGSDFTAKELGAAYAKGAIAYKEDEVAAEEIRKINKAIYERNDQAINELYDEGRQVSLDYFEAIYQIVGTKFDYYFFESEAGPRGRDLVLANPDIFPESDGARIFEGEKYGLHTRVFINKEGLPTYEAKELALAKLKEEAVGEYDHSVICTANEISEYFKVLLKAMSFVYPKLTKKTEHVGHGMVRLVTGKMSSRTGDVISAADFINDIAAAAEAKLTEGGKSFDSKIAEQIAIGAIKYATLKSNIRLDSVFDKEKALSFEGDSGPYLQYTHARICSVLGKAKAAGVEPGISKLPEETYEVEKWLYQFPEVVEEALLERSPHLVTVYLTKLAGAFNTFYANEKIADATDEFAPYKVVVADSVRQTLKNGLWVLGIEAPEKM